MFATLRHPLASCPRLCVCVCVCVCVCEHDVVCVWTHVPAQVAVSGHGTLKAWYEQHSSKAVADMIAAAGATLVCMCMSACAGALSVCLCLLLPIQRGLALCKAGQQECGDLLRCCCMLPS